MYRKKPQYIEGSVPTMVSGIHEESWKVPPWRRLLYLSVGSWQLDQSDLTALVSQETQPLPPGLGELGHCLWSPG